MAQEPSTHEIVEDGKAIKCLVCRMVSHNPIDIANKYCGDCHAFHPIGVAAQPVAPAPEPTGPPAQAKPILSLVPPSRDCLIVVTWAGRYENAGDLVAQFSALVGANPDAWGKPSVVLLPPGAGLDVVGEDRMRTLGWVRAPAGPPAG